MQKVSNGQAGIYVFFTLLRHIIVLNEVMENHSWTFVYNAKCINTGTCASYTTTAKLYKWLLRFHSSDIFIIVIIIIMIIIINKIIITITMVF